MILLNTTFHLDPSCFDRRTFFDIIVKWAEYSKFCHLSFDGFDWDADEFKIASEDGCEQAVINNLDDVFAVQLTSPGDKSSTYVTTYVLRGDKTGVPVMHVLQEKIFQSVSLDSSDDISVNMPNILKDIFWNEYGGDDNGILTDIRPIILRKSDIDLGVKILTNRDSFTNPVVYIPCPRNGEYPVDCELIAQELAGQAHVVVESSPIVSASVQAKTGAKRNSIEVYFPNSDEGSSSVSFDDEDVAGSVIKMVRKVQSMTAIPDQFDINKIRQAYMFAKLGDNEATRICEEMIQDRDLRIKQLENDLRETKKLLSVARSKADNLQGQFDAKSADNDDPAGEPFSFTEKPLYEGEIKDVILRVLQKEYDSIKDDTTIARSRKCHVLKDILDHNFPCTTGIELDKCIRGAFDDGVLTGVGIGRLQASGFVVEKTDRQAHYRVTLGGDDRYVMMVASTPSDKARGAKNAVSNFCNLLFGY